MEQDTRAFVWEYAEQVANEEFDGHLTVMKFTTNWKACFGTPAERHEMDQMETGKTAEEALKKAIRSRTSPDTMLSAKMLYNPPY